MSVHFVTVVVGDAGEETDDVISPFAKRALDRLIRIYLLPAVQTARVLLRGRHFKPRENKTANQFFRCPGRENEGGREDR